MKYSKHLIAIATFFLWLGAASDTFAQTNDLTYQGRLSDGPTPANGNYDFIFKLFDDPEDPAAPQIGLDQVRDDVSVTSGIFTVVLNFGSTAFDGAGQRFVEIYVR